MGKVIAGIYEIEREIGSGGGGIVFLGHHLRLQKKIVLKADRRPSDIDMTELRREVDVLKSLSNTYIPQVYDFVLEDDVVYTVMDFVEGESLDRMLKRGVLPSQAEVIRWGCQLLDALNYLHTRKPHGILHGDIKPANVMLRPDGSVCLIDFNIAVFLTDDGTAQGGLSRGYASPEHYGISYISSGRKNGKNTYTAVPTESPAELQDTGEDMLVKSIFYDAIESGQRNVSGSSGRRNMLLDARSDIYSLGATLYHMISGSVPAQNAVDVKELDASVCRPEVARILKKAMEPVRENRYASAEQMLNAFLGLYRTDARTRRHRRRMKTAAAVLALMFLSGGAMTYTGMRRIQSREQALNTAAASGKALEEGDAGKAVEYALKAVPRGNSIFDAPVTAEAQYALAEALHVYRLGDSYVPQGVLSLPGTPFHVSISSDGAYAAVPSSGGTAVFSTESKEQTALIPMQESALAGAVFAGKDRLICAGKDGILCCDPADGKELWSGEPATRIAVSADGRQAAAVYRDSGKFHVYDVQSGRLLLIRTTEGFHMPVPENDQFADPGDGLLSLSPDGNFLAMSGAGGAFRIFDLRDAKNDIIVFDETEYDRFEGGFCGKYFAFSASDGVKSLFQIVDMETVEVIAGYEADETIHVKADESGIFVARGNLIVKAEPETEGETELAFGDGQSFTGFSVSEFCTLAATDRESAVFYDRGGHFMQEIKGEKAFDFAETAGKYAVLGDRNTPEVRLLRLENHEEAEYLAYDAGIRHDEARISADRETVMLFDIYSFTVLDAEGKPVNRTELPEPEKIYDQQFRRKGKDSWLEVIWYDGTVREYDAADGALLSEKKEEAPGKDLYEEFETEHYRVTSPLHGTPEVFDLSSGKKLASLEKDCYLTYFTEVEGGFVAEYVDTEGNRFGYLMNSRFEKTAYLPGLCDVLGERLYFDYPSGHVRRAEIYDMDELTAAAEEYLEKDR